VRPPLTSCWPTKSPPSTLTKSFRLRTKLMNKLIVHNSNKQQLNFIFDYLGIREDSSKVFCKFCKLCKVYKLCKLENHCSVSIYIYNINRCLWPVL
jgi:hypothetical protein